MEVRVGVQRKLSVEESMLLSCGFSSQVHTQSFPSFLPVSISYFTPYFDETYLHPWRSWSVLAFNPPIYPLKDLTIPFSHPIISWQTDGEKVGTVAGFIFLGSKITADGDCSHEINRRLLLGRKAMTNLDSILKSRDITLSAKVHLVKAMVFPVVLYGCES